MVTQPPRIGPKGWVSACLFVNLGQSLQTVRECFCVGVGPARVQLSISQELSSLCLTLMITRFSYYIAVCLMFNVPFY